MKYKIVITNYDQGLLKKAFKNYYKKYFAIEAILQNRSGFICLEK